MDITSFEQVIPEQGILAAHIFENKHIGLEPTLFFDIEILLRPFEFKGAEVSTSVRLAFIRIPLVDDWREIAGQTYRFPTNPEEGYIDGSIYLDEAHTPADATLFAFGAIDSGRISCRVQVTFDFTYEGPEELGTPTLEWDVQLALNEQALDDVLAEARRLPK